MNKKSSLSVVKVRDYIRRNFVNQNNRTTEGERERERERKEGRSRIIRGLGGERE